MKTNYFFLSLLVLITNFSLAQQEFRQYFDGEDTLAQSSINISINNQGSNIWQIGKPQKSIFESAATQPNALVTDTINNYPTNNTSSFQFSIIPWTNWGVLALQWKQKLDMDKGLDGGKIEFSLDGGLNWENVFNNPGVYNFYGFNPESQDTLPNGEIVLSGTDSSWKDVWLCYDLSWLSFSDSLTIRFTFSSDSIDNNKEGWIIDNLLAHLTIVHTVSELKSEKYLNVFPNPSSDILNIQAEKRQEFHIIEQMTLVNSVGQIVDEWNNVPTKFFINTKNYTNGIYYLKITTNIKSETIPIVIKHN